MDRKGLAPQLRSVISNLHKSLRKQMSMTGTYSMTEMETISLLMHHGRLLPSELASRTRVKTQSMSQIINKLEDLKIIVRTPSKTDKRKVYISLTAFGKKMVEKTQYERDEKLQKAIDSALSDKEKELLGRAVPLLDKVLLHI